MQYIDRHTDKLDYTGIVGAGTKSIVCSFGLFYHFIAGATTRRVESKCWRSKLAGGRSKENLCSLRAFLLVGVIILISPHVSLYYKY